MKTSIWKSQESTFDVLQVPKTYLTTSRSPVDPKSLFTHPKTLVVYHCSEYLRVHSTYPSPVVPASQPARLWAATLKAPNYEPLSGKCCPGLQQHEALEDLA